MSEKKTVRLNITRENLAKLLGLPDDIELVHAYQDWKTWDGKESIVSLELAGNRFGEHQGQIEAIRKDGVWEFEPATEYHTSGKLTIQDIRDDHPNAEISCHYRDDLHMSSDFSGGGYPDVDRPNDLDATVRKQMREMVSRHLARRGHLRRQESGAEHPIKPKHKSAETFDEGEEAEGEGEGEDQPGLRVVEI